MTITSVAELGTVLCVWAHPDDEAYLSAGIMALAAAEGQRVVCITATKGESGSPDPDRWTPDQMAVIREAELYACLDVLGVEEHRWLGYVDGECQDVDVDGPASELTAIIREVQPDSILTFGPEGFTGHDDHCAVSAWTTEAHRRAGADRPRPRLHYVTQPASWIAEFAPRWRELDAFPPSLPLCTPSREMSIAIELPPEVVDQKVRALGAQMSQTAPVRAALGDDFYARSFAVECYRAAVISRG